MSAWTVRATLESGQGTPVNRVTGQLGSVATLGAGAAITGPVTYDSYTLWRRLTVTTSGHGLRYTVPLVALESGLPYTISWWLANDGVDPVTVRLDWCDVVDSVRDYVIQPGEVRKVLTSGARAYDSTYRFGDLTIVGTGSVLFLQHNASHVAADVRQGQGLVLEGSLDQWTDPDGPEPTFPALESVRWSDALEDSPAWPRRQAVSTGQVVFVVEDAVDASWITSRSVAWLEIRTPADAADPVAQFVGRCSDPILTAHDQGTRVSVGVTDLLSDLAEYTAGGVAYAAQEVDNRLAALFAEAGANAPGVGAWLVFQTVAARSASATDLLSLVRDLLDGAMFGRLEADPYTGSLYYDWELVEIRPAVYQGRPSLGVDDLQTWSAIELQGLPESTAPLVIVNDGGTWDLEADLDAAATVDAGAVEFDGTTWSRRTDRVLDTVEVVLANGSVVRLTTGPVESPAVYRRETQLTDPAEAAVLANELLVPAIGPDSTESWQGEAFTARVEAMGDVFPFQLRAVMAIGGIPTRHHPEALPWHVGVVQSREFVAAGNTLEATVQLVGQATVPGPESLTWAEAAALGFTWNQLATTVTWDRLSHTRN